MSDIESNIIEAGALLGAIINGYGALATPISPPKGTHSSFSIMNPTPSSGLLSCLHSLRGFLRSVSNDNPPLVAAPSILQVLMKLLGVSSNLAASIPPSSSSGLDPTRRSAIPPMLSTPLRKLWVDCVVLCHVLGDGLAGSSRIDTNGFIKNMISLAGINPRTAKAAGGTRIAALEAIAGIIGHEKLAKQLSNWTIDVIQLCQRALKSSGTGEPSYRIAGIRTASSAAIACRTAFLQSRDNTNALLLKGALEDKAIVEMVKLLKIAVADTYPEVRNGGASLAAIIAPLVIHTRVKSSKTPDAPALTPSSSLEDLMTIGFKNLDDESPMVAGSWAEALARCISTSIQYNNVLNSERTLNRNVEGDEPSSDASSRGKPANRASRKSLVSISMCPTLAKSLSLLVSMFQRAGGELSQPKSGVGIFSRGGRASRNGLARTMIELLRFQSSLDGLGEGKSISHKGAIAVILSMVDSSLDTHSSTTGQPVSGSALFGSVPRVSSADISLAQLASGRVLREGLSMLSSESTQISILHELVHLIGNDQPNVNGRQLQVALIEISHLLSTLGEATSSAVEDLMPALRHCLRHPDQGVRHEGSITCAAIAAIFPSLGRQFVSESLEELQLEHGALLAISSKMPVPQNKPEAALGARFARFRRQTTPNKELKSDESAKHKQSIHGLTLVVSVVLRDLPNLPGGLPVELEGRTIAVAEILVSTLFNDIMTGTNPGGVCTCVKGGFALLSGALAAGTDGLSKHVPTVFQIWQRVAKNGNVGGSFTDAHELVCTSSMLGSIVVFLRYCSSLLLSIPDALSKISLLLEETLPLILPSGRLGKVEAIPAAVTHIDSARASILEAFAWLPPGSYPMIADEVFEFSAINIQRSVEKETSCSILRSLVSIEDIILDATSFSRATGFGQVGGASDLENDLITLKAEVATHDDREAVLHLLKTTQEPERDDVEFMGSQVLGTVIADTSREKAPTPLHEVGTWRRPVVPSCSAKVRLIDASIQAFAATFTLKSGKEQLVALRMLESLLPPAHLQVQRSSMSEASSRGKKQEDSASAANVAAVLLYCLKALPVFESTHNVPIHLGPQWMSKAKDIFCTLLRSPSQEIRRAAAEGLAFLSTIGVREDARFLQSAVLHDLDAVIQGTQDQEQGKQISIDTICAGRSAAVHALACMQRTAYKIEEERADRAKERGNSESKLEETEEILPLFQILIKILPSITIRPTGGFLGVRAVGMHAFGLLFSYSKKLNMDALTVQESHLLKKVIELIEDNFLSAWTAASSEYDHGTDEDKLSSEISFVAVLLRLMTLMTPFLNYLDGVDKGTALRFSHMSRIAVECFGAHPTVRFEAMAFHEILSQHQNLLPNHVGGLKYSEHPILSCIPMLLDSINPRRSALFVSHEPYRLKEGLESRLLLRASVKVVRFLSMSNILVAEWSGMEIISSLFAAMEHLTGTQVFSGSTLHRTLSAPREAEVLYKALDATPRDLAQVMRLLVLLERSRSSNCVTMLLRYILLARSIVNGASNGHEEENEENETISVTTIVDHAQKLAYNDAAPLFTYCSSPRWQIKTLAVQVMAIGLRETREFVLGKGTLLTESPVFNPRLTKAVIEKNYGGVIKTEKQLPHSSVALHIGAVATSACGMATATIDQVELRCLQESAMYLVYQVLECFASISDPDESGGSVLQDDIPQIAAAIKNALGSREESIETGSCRLFFAACQTLQMFVKSNITTDPSVLKRVFRPILPDETDFSFFRVNEKLSYSISTETRNKYSNTRSNLLIPIGTIWTLGSIPKNHPELESLITVSKLAIGANAGGLAIEGAHLLRNDGFTLGGVKATNFEKLGPQYLFNWSEIDYSAKNSLTSKWADLLATSVSFFSLALPSEDDPEMINLWLKKLIPYLFAGLRDALQVGEEGLRSKGSSQKDSNHIASACLRGITTVASNAAILELEDELTNEINSSLTLIATSIFEKVLLQDNVCIEDLDLVRNACTLLLKLATNLSQAVSENSPLLLAALRPLSLLQSGKVDILEPAATLIISACFTASSKILSLPSSAISVSSAVLDVAFQLSTVQQKLPISVKASILSLVNTCLENGSVSISEQSEMAVALAKAGDWETWSVTVSARDGIAAKASLSVVQECILECTSKVDNHKLLGTIQKLLQLSPPPSDLAGRLLSLTIGEILVIFEAFGTREVSKELMAQKNPVCSQCMKIALVAIQQFSADNTTDEDMSQFLVVLFQSFIAVIRFNGLPNHPIPHPGLSDPSVGKMCAQAITHIARAAATAFKMTMGFMAEQDRSVLEFAVRADMSGYASARTEPTPKKKLSLKGFKK